MKKVWILNHYSVPKELGPWIRHYKFGEELIKKGHGVKIFAASTIHNTSKNLIEDSSKYLYKEFNGVPFIFIKTTNYNGNGIKRIINMFFYSIRVLFVSRKFENEKPDVIYASSAHPLTWVSGYILAKKYNAKFIAETRDLWPETFVAMGKLSRRNILARILYKLEKVIYKRADKLLFTFPGGKDYVESIGIDTTKVRYINNGVDLEEFNNNKNKYIYEDDILNSDSFNIVYTGSMGIANSLNYIVESALLIQNNGFKDITFMLFGDGYQREELEEFVQKNNIKNVIFKGRVEKKYIPSILSKSDLNIFTGKYIDLYKYGLSLNKMFEYFASGKPTLSNIECGYDLLVEYGCGITVKGGSAESLAEGILKYYNLSKKEYDSYCKNALKAAQDFDFKILANKLEEIILED